MRDLLSPARASGIKRLAAIVSLAAIFFLPLHFHSVTGLAKAAKECACAQGTRTVAALAAPPPTVVPILSIQPLAVSAGAKYERFPVSRHSIRAPPALAFV